MAFEDSFRTLLGKFKMPDIPDMNLKGSVDGLRASFHRASRSVEKDLPDLAEISNLIVEGASGPLKSRLYIPLAAGRSPAPAILFFHGGGFVMGDLESHDIICRRLAAGSRCRVLAINYRLAPENKFPAAHDDALAAWRWLTRPDNILGIDPNRIAVAGDSAGGNLSAFIAQEMNRTGGQMPAFQLLLYPLVQFSDIRSKKMNFQESGFFISSNLFEYFRDSYVEREVDRMDVRVSPLFAEDRDFSGLPPAHLVLCGWDPLKDEGRAYASKLAAHGVPVTIREHPGMVHGFMNMTAWSTSIRTFIGDAGKVAGKALGAINVE